MKSARVTLLCAALFASGVDAQHPDFSGSWTEAGAPAGARDGDVVDLGSGWGPAFTIVQRSDSLIIERIFFSRGDLQPPMKFRYALDGTETRNAVLMGRGEQEQFSRAVREGASVVITTRHVDPAAEGGRGVSSETRHVLSLQPARLPAWPPSLIVETTRVGTHGGRSSTTRTVYTRG